jgi:intracellular sulfur oxidation DsrE/DsrF family protein
MRFLTRTLAKEARVSYETMRAELVGGLLPGVTVVPAKVVALGLAQERGCAYVYAGG